MDIEFTLDDIDSSALPFDLFMQGKLALVPFKAFEVMNDAIEYVPMVAKNSLLFILEDLLIDAEIGGSEVNYVKDGVPYLVVKKDMWVALRNILSTMISQDQTDEIKSKAAGYNYIYPIRYKE